VLTHRPGRVKASVPIEISRESRRWDVLGAEERFARYRHEILKMIREEFDVQERAGEAVQA